MGLVHHSIMSDQFKEGQDSLYSCIRVTYYNKFFLTAFMEKSSTDFIIYISVSTNCRIHYKNLSSIVNHEHICSKQAKQNNEETIYTL